MTWGIRRLPWHSNEKTGRVEFKYASKILNSPKKNVKIILFYPK
jgi:hypothetical protein